MATLLLGLALLPIALAAEQAPVANGNEVDQALFDVQVDVRSRSLEDRRRGAQRGLRQVLTRLTGLQDVPDSAALDAALEAPERYYTQYRYISTDRIDDLGAPVTTLRLRFAAPALRRLIGAADLPLWTLRRPTVAVWLVERQGSEAVFVTDPEHPLLRAVLEQARRRGLPVLLAPGSEAAVRVTAADVWRAREVPLASASRALGASLVLAGRAEALGPDLVPGAEPEDWRARWVTWLDDEPRRLSLAGPPDQVGAPVVDSLADALANRFTVAGGQRGVLRVRVDRIGSVADYAAVLSYLMGLSYVDSTQVVSLQGDQLVLDVATGSGAAQFLDLLGVDNRLRATPVDVQAPFSFNPNELRVIWQG